MRSFASDNNSGVHPLVMEALSRANADHALSYGDDRWTEEAVAKIKEIFTPDCVPLFVFNGTGQQCGGFASNDASVSFNLLCGNCPYLCRRVRLSRENDRLSDSPIATTDGKLTPELMQPYLHGFGDQHHSQPRALYISQCTELGTIYTPEELKRLTDFAHLNGMYVHMDGARIANACAALHLSLKELTVDCGIDILSFGGTKNGLMMGECVIIFNKDLQREARFVRKQSAQLASKMRYLSCQFTAYLTDDLWLKNAAHANAMASKLYQALKELPEVTFTQKPESNQLFLTMPRPTIDRMLESYFFYFWNEANHEIRLVTSFDTTEEDVNQFIRLLRR